MVLSPIGVHDLIQMGTTGLVSFDRGIISTYPTTMHPKPSDTNKRKGRKKRARQGRPLDIEGEVVNEGVLTDNQCWSALSPA